jgi:hypothetical protein
LYQSTTSAARAATAESSATPSKERSPTRQAPALRQRLRRRLRQRLGLALLLGLLAASAPAPAPRAQDLTAPDEMVLQGDRLRASGRPCQAAARYRAVVGELPGVFLRYALARAECLDKPRTEQ